MSSARREERLRAAVVGLGQVGSRFDEEPGRTVPWSHVGAYLHLADRYRLVGAVDIAATNVAAFRTRCPDVPVYPDIAALLETARPQIASICTPPETHADVLAALLDATDIGLVWCEKPLSHDLALARRMVASCAERGVALMVSLNRHWLPLWRRARAVVAEGTLGTIRSVRVAMPNRILSIGSHCVDLALMLGGPVAAAAAIELPALEETGEKAVAAALRFRSGAGGLIQVTGLKRQLVVEAEVIGDDGRLRVCEDRNSIVTELFRPSDRYQGYRQLGPPHEEIVSDDVSAFVAMAENAADALTDRRTLECDGAHALEVQRVLALLTDGL